MAHHGEALIAPPTASVAVVALLSEPSDPVRLTGVFLAGILLILVENDTGHWKTRKQDLLNHRRLSIADTYIHSHATKVIAVLAKIDSWQFDSFELDLVTGGRPLSVLTFAILTKLKPTVPGSRWEAV